MMATGGGDRTEGRPVFSGFVREEIVRPPDEIANIAASEITAPGVADHASTPTDAPAAAVAQPFDAASDERSGVLAIRSAPLPSIADVPNAPPPPPSSELFNSMSMLPWSPPAYERRFAAVETQPVDSATSEITNSTPMMAWSPPSYERQFAVVENSPLESAGLMDIVYGLLDDYAPQADRVISS